MRTHPYPTPPVAANSTAPNVGHILPYHPLADVRMALQHANHVVAVKEPNRFVGVHYRQRMMLWFSRWRWHI